MKRLLSTLILFAAVFSATAAELPDYLVDLSEEYQNGMKIWAISDDDFEDDNDNEFFVLTFESRQDKRVTDKDFVMRVAVQLSDKKTQSVIFAQTEKQPAKLTPNSTYADKTEWEFRIPFGAMKKPKLTAYAIEFGFMADGYFVPVAAEYDEVESAEEIMAGEGSNMEIRCTKSSHFFYTD